MLTQALESGELGKADCFLFNREDHTLANFLVPQIRKNPQVEFAAYKIAHPHDPFFELRIHLVRGAGAKKGYKAETAIIEACLQLHNQLTTLSTNLSHEMGLIVEMREQNAYLERYKRNEPMGSSGSADVRAGNPDSTSGPNVEMASSTNLSANIQPSRSGKIPGSAIDNGAGYAAQYTSSYGQGGVYNHSSNILDPSKITHIPITFSNIAEDNQVGSNHNGIADQASENGSECMDTCSDGSEVLGGSK